MTGSSAGSSPAYGAGWSRPSYSATIAVRKPRTVASGNSSPKTLLRAVSPTPAAAMRSRYAAAASASALMMNRVPSSAPSAPRASTAASPRPSATPPAAITGTATASVTAGTRVIVPATLRLCPPASMPCATTASAPASTAATASAGEPTWNHTRVPASCSVSNHAGSGSSQKNVTTGTPAAAAMSSGPAKRGMMFTANGRSVTARTAAISASSSSGGIALAPIVPRPPAADTAAASGARAMNAMPAATTGTASPYSSDKRVRMTRP